MNERSWRWLWAAPAAACVLAPHAFQLCHHGPLQPWLSGQSFDDVWNLIFLVSGLAISAWVATGKGYSTPEAWGITALHHNRTSYASNAALGLGIVVALLTIQFWIGAREWQSPLRSQRLISALLSALVVPLFEEPLFRGVLIRELRLKIPVTTAVILQAFVFASLHFTHPPGYDKLVEAGSWTGFEFARDAVSYAFTLDTTGRRWAMLTVLGTLLGVMSQRQGHVWGCMGLHAGLVLGMLAYPAILDYDKGAWTPWMPKDFTLGLDALAVLMTLLFFHLYHVLRQKNSR